MSIIHAVASARDGPSTGLTGGAGVLCTCVLPVCSAQRCIYTHAEAYVYPTPHAYARVGPPTAVRYCSPGLLHARSCISHMHPTLQQPTDVPKRLLRTHARTHLSMSITARMA